MAVAALLGAGVLAVLAAYLFASVPLPEDLTLGATTVVDRNGNRVGTLSAHPSRRDVALADLPDHVPAAVLAAEDRGFYQHAGISPRGILRALATNVAAGEIEQGGSTITQQYIKNAALSRERTAVRKLKEAVLAVKLEQAYSKDQILEFYLNTIYLGRGTYGIDAAARTYFARPAAQLTVNEAATLAGLIRAPERFDPAEDPGAANIRRVYTLNGMVERGTLTRQQAQQLKAAGLPETTARPAAYGANTYYLDAVRRELAATLGEEAVFRGLTVVAEIDLGLQRFAEQTLRRHIGTLRDQLADDPPDEDFDLSQVSGGLVSVDPATGGVRALVGGANFAQQQFNAAVQGANQSGSAFKPFTLAAFVDAGFSPRSRFPAPPEMTVAFDGFPDYRVRNFGGRGYGTQTVRQATLTSTNVVYTQMTAEVGPAAVRETAVAAGLPDNDRLTAVPSITLGTAGVTVLDLASAYATVAGDGVRTDPRLIRRVEAPDGTTVVADRGPQREPAISANVAHVVSDVLVDNVRSGTGTAAQIDRPAAGKTGTTQDSRDAWFAGYVPQLATTVWFGTLDNSSMGDVTGGSVPAAAWGDYMRRATADMEVVGFPTPDYSGLEILGGQPPASPGPSSPAPAATTPVTGPSDGAHQPTPSRKPRSRPTPAQSPSPDDAPVNPLPTVNQAPLGGQQPSPSPTRSSPTSQPAARPRASPDSDR